MVAESEQPLAPAKPSKRSSELKWGKEVVDLGFLIVPSLLLQTQDRLGLTVTQLAILLNLADYWWDFERKPFPSKQTLATRLGIGARQVQRNIKALEDAGFLKRIPRSAPGKGKQTNEYDLSGLVAKLATLEPAATEARRSAREGLKQVSRKRFGKKL